MLLLRLLLFLHIQPPTLDREIQAPARALERIRDLGTSALQHIHQLGAQAVQAALDAADPAHTLLVKDLALDARGQQQQLLQPALHRRLVVVRVGLAPGRGEGRGRRREDAQRGRQVLRRHDGEGDERDRARQEHLQLVLLLAVGGHGVRALRQRVQLVGGRGRGQLLAALRRGRGRVGRRLLRRQLARPHGVPELDDAQGAAEDARLHGVDLDGVGRAGRRGAGGGQLLVDLAQRLGQLSPDTGPFDGAEVVVLEEQRQGRRPQQRGVLAQQLRLAELGWLVGGRLGGREALDGSGSAGGLLNGGRGGRGGGQAGVGPRALR